MERKILWKRIKDAFIMLTEPFIAVYDNFYTTLLWFAFSIIAGLMGPIINVIRYCFLDNANHSLVKSIYMDSFYGSFYTFAIVVSASLLGGLLIKWKENYKQNFRRIKVFAASFSIFLIMIGSVCYSFASLNNEHTSPIFDYSKTVVDIPQLVLFVLSIILAIYCQGINLMDDNPEQHDKANEDEAIMRDREQGVRNVISGSINAKEMEGAGL